MIPVSSVTKISKLHSNLLKYLNLKTTDPTFVTTQVPFKPRKTTSYVTLFIVLMETLTQNPEN